MHFNGLGSTHFPIISCDIIDFCINSVYDYDLYDLLLIR